MRRIVLGVFAGLLLVLAGHVGAAPIHSKAISSARYTKMPHSQRLKPSDLAGTYTSTNRSVFPSSVKIIITKSYTSDGFLQCDFKGFYGPFPIVGQVILEGDEDTIATSLRFTFLALEPQDQDLIMTGVTLMHKGSVVGIAFHDSTDKEFFAKHLSESKYKRVK